MRASAVTRAKAALVAAQQQFAANQARVDRTTVENHPDVLAAAAQVHDAYLDVRAHAAAGAGVGLRRQARRAARPARRARARR